MKRLTALLLLCVLSGCAHNSDLPAVSGKAEPINTPQIMKEFNHE